MRSAGLGLIEQESTAFLRLSGSVLSFTVSPAFATLLATAGWIVDDCDTKVHQFHQMMFSSRPW